MNNIFFKNFIKESLINEIKKSILLEDELEDEKETIISNDFNDENIDKTVSTNILNACKNDNFSILNININTYKRRGKDIQNIINNIRDSFGNTPLLLACKNNNLNMVKLLLDNGADIEVTNKRKETPFSITNDNDIKGLLSINKKKYDLDFQKQNLAHYKLNNKNYSNLEEPNIENLIINKYQDDFTNENKLKPPFNFTNNDIKNKEDLKQNYLSKFKTLRDWIYKNEKETKALGNNYISIAAENNDTDILKLLLNKETLSNINSFINISIEEKKEELNKEKNKEFDVYLPKQKIEELNKKIEDIKNDSSIENADEQIKILKDEINDLEIYNNELENYDNKIKTIETPIIKNILKQKKTLQKEVENLNKEIEVLTKETSNNENKNLEDVNKLNDLNNKKIEEIINYYNNEENINDLKNKITQEEDFLYDKLKRIKVEIDGIESYLDFFKYSTEEKEKEKIENSKKRLVQKEKEKNEIIDKSNKEINNYYSQIKSKIEDFINIQIKNIENDSSIKNSKEQLFILNNKLEYVKIWDFKYDFEETIKNSKIKFDSILPKNNVYEKQKELLRDKYYDLRISSEELKLINNYNNFNEELNKIQIEKEPKEKIKEINEKIQDNNFNLIKDIFEYSISDYNWKIEYIKNDSSLNDEEKQKKFSSDTLNKKRDVLTDLKEILENLEKIIDSKKHFIKNTIIKIKSKQEEQKKSISKLENLQKIISSQKDFINKEDGNGKTVIDYIKENKNLELLKLIDYDYYKKITEPSTSDEEEPSEPSTSDEEEPSEPSTSDEEEPSEPSTSDEEKEKLKLNKLLFYHCEKGDENLTKELIKKGADINYKNENDETPLSIAIKKENIDLAKKIIKIKDLKIKDLNDLLLTACDNGNKDLVNILIHKGADINYEDKYYRTPIKISLENKDDSLFYFLTHNDNINLTKEETAKLWYDNFYEDNLIKNGEKTKGEYINNKRDFNNKNINEELLKACSEKDVNLVKDLINRGANVNYTNKYHQSPIERVYKNSKSLSIIKTLIYNNAKMNDYLKNEILILAVRQNDLDLIKILLNKKADINYNNGQPLNIACEKDNTNTIKYLIENGADIYFEDYNGDTIFDIAVKNKNYNIINYLIKKEFKFSEKTIEKTLDFICSKSNLYLLKLIEDKIDYNKNYFLRNYYRGGKKQSILEASLQFLEYAKEEKYINFLKHVINKTTNKDFINKSLINACKCKNLIQTINLLINKGADINYKNENGETPLNIAFKENIDTEIISLLIDKGADVNYKNEFGDTPLESAINRNRSNYILLLLDKGIMLNEKNFEEIKFHLKDKKHKDKDDIILMFYLVKNNKFKLEKEDIENTIEIACQENNFKLLELLKNNNININIDYCYSEACYYRSLSVINYLLEQKKSIKKEFLNKFFEIACEENSLVLIKNLINKDLKINEYTIEKSLKNENYEIIDYLFKENKIDKNLLNNVFIEILDYIPKEVTEKYFNIFNYLIDNNFINLNEPKVSKHILYSFERPFPSSFQLLQFFTKKGLNLKESELNEILISYCINFNKNNLKTINLLLDNGADINYDNGDTPLGIFAEKKDCEMVDYLLKKGATPKDEKTLNDLLLCYCDNNNENDFYTIKHLIDKGADVNYKNELGETPLNVTYISKIEDLLKDNGAKELEDSSTKLISAGFITKDARPTHGYFDFEDD